MSAGVAAAPAEPVGPGASTALRVVRALVVVWGFEIVLARVSCDTQIARDMIVSALGLACVGLLPLPLVRLAPLPPRARRLLTALVAVTPAAVVGLGIVAPPAWHAGRAALVALFAALAVAIGVWGRRVWRGGDPVPGPAPLFAVLATASLAGWALQRVGMPPLPIVGGTLALGGALALLAGRAPGWLGAPAAAALAVGVGLWPLGPPDVQWSAEGPAPAGPDIVLVTVDTLRADAAERMQSVQRLARAGVDFESAQAASPWTLPSMATVVTGLSVSEHGAGRWSDVQGYAPMQRGRETLATRLAEHGYDTAAVVAPNGMVERRFGFDRGFATYDYALELGRYALPKGIDRSGIGRPVMTRLAMVLRIGGRRPTGDAHSLVRRAIHVLDRRRDRPLFLWIHFLDCHLPYRHAEETSLPFSRKIALSAGPGKPEIVADPWWSSPEGREALWTAYMNEVRHIDRALVRLLDRLEQGERDTAIVFTSDHGEEIFEHGDFEHGHELFQEVVEVPLLLVHPALEPGTRVERVVGHIDVAPTLLAAAGIPDPSLPGQDLAGEIETAAYTSENMLFDGPAEDRFSVRRGRWKAIVTKGEEPALYDLSVDPAETRDLAPSHPEVARDLVALRREVEREPQEAAPMDEELKDALRALGYAAD